MIHRSTIVWVLVMICALRAGAQNGDKAGETQALRIPAEKIPPAPPLSPAEQLKTLTVPQGFEVQLVAAEPLVEAPIAAQFDPEGRLYVVEMRGFMTSPDAQGEDQPTGRISILEDTDGDGRMDRRTTFVDGLVLPRAMALYNGGLLVGEPPQLWFYCDRDGDGKADEKVSVASDYGDRKNPEHTANGLVLDMDNWVYNLYHTWRYRWSNGRWDRQPIPNRVQWGLTQDDFGRLFFTSNSDPLRGDYYASAYAGGRAPTAKVPFLNVQVETNMAVWPGRINPGVNRGYQPKQLRDDGTLATFTAACGTWVYRGDQFPEDYRGAAFVCEPSANLIRCERLADQGGRVTGSNALGEREFLTSTDERFRPVNLLDGPDGALYIVNFERGIIQHRIYMTTYLRKQVEARGLDKPLDHGRIYRVVHKGRSPGRRPSLSKATAAELVQELNSPSGWWRDTAQRLLIERAEKSAVPALEELAAGARDPRSRVQALWTLEGLGRVTTQAVARAIHDPHPKVRLTGLRVAEPLLRASAGPAGAGLRRMLLKVLENGSTEVRVQAALTLGTIAWDPEVRSALQQAHDMTASAWVKSAAALGLGLLDPPKQPSTPAGPPMSAEEQKRFESGKAVFNMACAACHQPHGLGQEGLAPPLVGSEWVAGPPTRLVRIVLHGLRGPITVKGQSFQLEMPTLGVLEDEQIALALSYVRREWGHNYPPVETALVKQIREATSKREDAWTVPDLLRVQ
jgi:glucose/arabinose dehydrogenase/mono/diheme cytochrome c family protein